MNEAFRLDLVKSEIEKKAPTVFDKLEAAKIDLYKVYSKPPTVIEVLTDEQSAVLGTLDNFSCIIGKAKSKKSFLMSIIAASAIKNDVVYNKINCDFPDDKQNVVVFDTEQSDYKVHQIANRIKTISGKRIVTNLDVYCLRPYHYKERIEMIEAKIYNTENLGLVVIDGIRDLVADINSPEEATEIVGKLMKWTSELNIHIMTVLHQNKGNTDARGHLGTEVINKAETVISVLSSEDGVCSVSPEFTREKEFAAFAFKVDNNGIPEVCDAAVSSKLNKPNYYNRDKHLEVLAMVFKENTEFSSIELCQGISEQWKIRHREPMGITRAKTFRSYYVEQGFITEQKAQHGNKTINKLSNNDACPF